MYFWAFSFLLFPNEIEVEFLVLFLQIFGALSLTSAYIFINPV